MKAVKAEEVKQVELVELMGMCPADYGSENTMVYDGMGKRTSPICYIIRLPDYSVLGVRRVNN